MKKLFIGIALSPEAKQTAVGVQDRVREVATRQGVRFTNPEKLHMTLAFLGSHPEDAIPKIAIACAPICELLPPFRLDLAGLGAFPHLHRPRVLWIGVGGELPLLTATQKAIASALDNYVEGEQSEFSPHITIARITPGSPAVGRAVAPISDELGQDELASWTVDEIVLYESTPDGNYVALQQWPLSGSMGKRPKSR